jgi:hypothetical protein
MLSALLMLALASAPVKAPAPAKAPPAPVKAAPSPLEWQVPGHVSTLEVPGKMDVAGIPVRFLVHTSREPVEKLLQHFANAFSEAGFYIQRNQKRRAAQPHLAALDTRSLTSYTVILNPEPGGLTTVVVGEARLKEFQPAAPPSSLPVFPGGSDLLHANFEGARTLSYKVTAKEADIRAWYREQLGRAGFSEEAPLLFRRQEQELRVSLESEAGRISVFLFLQTAPGTESLGLEPP